MFFKRIRKVEKQIKELNETQWQFAYWKKGVDPQFKKTEGDIQNLQEKIHSMPDLVECETCGCAIKKDTAVKGESIIKKRESMFFAMRSCFKEENREEYIHQVYYCKRCAPKDKTKNKEEK